MLRISRQHWEELRRHGEEAYPHECCGVLLGDTDGSCKTVRDLMRCVNTRTDSPQNRYHIAPEELVRILHLARKRELEIIGFYHSHPDHPARWSPTDLEEAHWPGCSYVITSVEQGRAAQTNSFTLLGESDEQKQFKDEDLEVAVLHPSGNPPHLKGA